MIRIAVIADPHVHDTTWQPAGSGLGGALRSYADTAASTRVFNESLPAFRAALDRAVSEGARLVVVPGDLTDDGQRHNIDCALAVIAEYERQCGLRVFMTPGNHDFFARAGRRQVKQFLASDGRRVVLDSRALPDMAMLGAPEALGLLADLGVCPHPGDLHFETPFGHDPDFAARTHRAASPDGATAFEMIDASYLIEPVEGLWLLSIDANVVTPRNGATDLDDPAHLHDPTDGGWPAVLRSRPYLVDWMRDVAARAEAAGKMLVAFSHYPALDPLAGTSAEERALFGASGLARRDPGPLVATAFARTGVRLHVSGHLHVNDTALYREGDCGFFNIAVPSPVGFVPAMKILDLAPDHVRLRTIRLDEVPGHDVAFAGYRLEASAAGEAARPAAFAPNHIGFLDRHLSDLVAERYMAREWPAEMAAFTRSGQTGDLERLLWPGALPVPGDAPFALQLLADDWYRLRKAGDLALDLIPAERLALYRRWIAMLETADTAGLAGQFAAFLAMLGRYLSRTPTLDIQLDLKRLEIEAVQGRTLRRQTV